MANILIVKHGIIPVTARNRAGVSASSIASSRCLRRHDSCNKISKRNMGSKYWKGGGKDVLHTNDIQFCIQNPGGNPL